MGKYQVLVYADDINMLGENLQTIRRNATILLKASENIGLELNSEKTKYIITSCHQNVVQNQNIIANVSFQNMGKLKYLGVMIRNTNDIRMEIRYSIEIGNTYY